MKITIVVEDKIVAIGGKPLVIENIDWSIFDMDPSNPDDDISAVQFNTEAGNGHVEFKTRPTKQINRPSHRPPDWYIGQADFDQYFGFVVQAYEARKKQIEDEKAAKAAEVPTEAAPVEPVASEPVEPIEIPPPADTPIQSAGSWGQILSSIDAPVAPEPETPVPQVIETPVDGFQKNTEDIAPQPPPMPVYKPTPITKEDLIAALKDTSARYAEISPRTQARYELAIQAKNGSTYAMGLFTEEAAIRGSTVLDLASSIIDDRGAYEKLVMRLSVIEAKAISDINAAETVEQATAIAETAINDMGAKYGEMDRGGA